MKKTNLTDNEMAVLQAAVATSPGVADLVRRAIAEIRESRSLLAPRVVEVDETNCAHNSAIDPDTGTCLTCGTVLP